MESSLEVHCIWLSSSSPPPRVVVAVVGGGERPLCHCHPWKIPTLWIEHALLRYDNILSAKVTVERKTNDNDEKFDLSHSKLCLIEWKKSNSSSNIGQNPIECIGISNSVHSISSTDNIDEPQRHCVLCCVCVYCVRIDTMLLIQRTNGYLHCGRVPLASSRLWMFSRGHQQPASIVLLVKQIRFAHRQNLLIHLNT